MKLVIDIPDGDYRYIKELQSLIIARGTCKTIQRDVINAIKNGTPYEERPIGEWIPVKYRPLTVDECIAFADHYGIEYCDTVDEKAFDCPMPEDGQEILVSTSWGVSTDVADNDIDCEGFVVYGLEGNGDWECIDAWMPLPEPYKKDGDV